MNKVLFRTDGNTKMGTGHVMRCMALAQALHKQGIDSVFVLTSSALAICRSRHDWVGQLITIPAQITLAEEPLWLAGLCQQQNISALVLDGYQFDAEYRKSVSKITGCFVLFDDNNDTGPLWADVVINGADNAQQLGYERNSAAASLCLGPRYKVLRQEFVDLPASGWAERQTLGIMLGGSDPLNLSLPLLQALQAHVYQCQLPPISLFTGPAYSFSAQLNEFLSHSHLAIKHLVNCQQIAEEFSRCRLVISAAGSSQFELLACRTPAILLVVADNQLNATVQASQQGWCQMMDARQGLDMQVLANEVVQLIGSDERLMNMHRASAQYRDVDGAQRVAKVMIEHCQRQGS